jgi:hypothetical protein
MNVEIVVLDDLKRRRRAVGQLCHELLMQAQPLGERFAQRLIVIDQ